MADSKRRRYELESILETVMVDGFVLVSRAKFTSLANRERERSEIWEEVQELYEGLQGDPSELRGKRVGSKILITRFDLDENPYAIEPFEPKAAK